MNILDAVVIGITLILGIKGFFNGFVKEIAGLIGVVAGLFVASKFYHQTGVYINENIIQIKNSSAVDLIGFIVDFVGVWGVVVLIGFIFSKVLKISALGFIDRFFGFLFAGAKFFVLVSVIAVMLNNVAFIKEKLSPYVKDSITFPILITLGNKIINIDSKEIENIRKNVKIP